MGKGQTIKADSVSQGISAINQTISLATGRNPFKVAGSDNFIPAIAEMLTGWRKLDPPTKKMFPVSVDLQKFVCIHGVQKNRFCP